MANRRPIYFENKDPRGTTVDFNLTYRVAPMRNTILICVLLTICISGCTSTISSVRPELEPFARSEDYDYGLTHLADANNLALSLTQDGFTWPTLAQGVDTALLEISLRRTHGQYPAIEINAGGVNIIQYFEQGGRGRRYLDLSPLLKVGIQPGQFIEFTSRGAQWNSASWLWHLIQMMRRSLLLVYTNPPWLTW